MVVEITQDDAGVRTCPRCSATFDGSHIGATREARILCPECSSRVLDSRRYWWQAEEPIDGR